MKLSKLLLPIVFIVGGIVVWMARPGLDKMVGQMIMTGFHGDGTGENAADFDEIVDQIRSGTIGGVILFDVDLSGLRAAGLSTADAKKRIFSSNIKNMDQVRNLTKKLQSVAPTKLLIAIDQEGGKVQRLKPEHGFVSIPSAAEMGRGDVENTAAIAYDLGNRLADLGINVDFAPLLDVNVNPKSPAIGAMDRSFSDNPDTVVKHAAAFAGGLDKARIGYSFKHFPGHGSSGTDTHMGITDVTNTYQPYEMDVYRRILPNVSDGAMVMAAHVINKNIDSLPASLSKKSLDLIREMGFNGIIISDDLDMGAIANEYDIETALVMAINAGNDILIFGNNLSFDKNRGRDVHNMIVDLVKSGKIKRSRIYESYRRIKKLKSYIR